MIKDTGALFEEKGFPAGISMWLARPEPWQWTAVAHKAQRQAAALREGGAVLTGYGFESEEFGALADPDTWTGIAEFIYAVELGMTAIKSWAGVEMAGQSGALPIEREYVARLFRIQKVRDHFLAVMAREGERYRIEPAEGNA